MSTIFTAIIVIFISSPGIYILGQDIQVLDGFRSLVPKQFKDPDLKFNLSRIYNSRIETRNYKTGKVGFEFWAVWNPCPANCMQMKNIVPRLLHQIDIGKQLLHQLDPHLKLVTKSESLVYDIGTTKIILGISEDYSISSSLSMLRIYYDLGVRSISLTSYCPMTRTVKNDALTDFGEAVVRLANALGMMIEVSNTSDNIRKKVIELSKSPVIFAHSAYSAICNYRWNVNDAMLDLVKKNKKALIMVPFHPDAIRCDGKPAGINDVVDHIVKIAVKVEDHQLALSGYFGRGQTVIGLENNSKFPELFKRIKAKNPKYWTEQRLNKIASQNFIEAFKAVEKATDVKIMYPLNPILGLIDWNSMNPDDCS